MDSQGPREITEHSLLKIPRYEEPNNAHWAGLSESAARPVGSRQGRCTAHALRISVVLIDSCRAWWNHVRLRTRVTSKRGTTATARQGHVLALLGISRLDLISV